MALTGFTVLRYRTTHNFFSSTHKHDSPYGRKISTSAEASARSKQYCIHYRHDDLLRDNAVSGSFLGLPNQPTEAHFDAQRSPPLAHPNSCHHPGFSIDDAAFQVCMCRKEAAFLIGTQRLWVVLNITLRYLPSACFLVFARRPQLRTLSRSMFALEATEYVLSDLPQDGRLDICATRYRPCNPPTIPAGGGTLALLCIHAVSFSMWPPITSCV